MEGHYHNPHAIQPGEILTPQLLFQRYLDWHEYEGRVAIAYKQGPKCNDSLFIQGLCCADHMRLQEELSVFFRYFALLEMAEEGKLSFSLSESVSLVKRFKINPTETLREKLGKYWRGDAVTGFRMLEL